MTVGFNESDPKQYYHPICHLALGERLYYLLLRSAKNLEDVKNDVGRTVQREGLGHAACIYVLFGDKDLLIRCWGSDNHVRKLATVLRRVRGVSACTTHLIEEMSTWYQREMEYERYQREMEHERNLGNSAVPAIDKRLQFERLALADGQELPREFRYSANSRGADAPSQPTKFFVFGTLFERDLPKIFDGVRNKLESPDAWPPDLIQTSLYSFRGASSHGAGLVIKTETAVNSKWPSTVLALTNQLRQLGVKKTTTYVCAETLIESHNISSVEWQAPLNTRKFFIVQNLLMSHGCRPTDLEARRGHHRKHRASRVAELVSHGCFDLLQTGKSWDENLRKLRFVYRAVTFRQNAELKSFLMMQYANLENAVRIAIDAEFQKWNLAKIDDARKDFKKFVGLNKSMFADVGALPELLKGFDVRGASEKIAVHDEPILPELLKGFMDHAHLVIEAIEKALSQLSKRSEGGDWDKLLPGIEGKARQITAADSRLPTLDPSGQFIENLVKKIQGSIDKQPNARSDNEEECFQASTDTAAKADMERNSSLKEDIEILKRFMAVIKLCARHRDEFMHGNSAINDLFSTTDKNRAYVFEEKIARFMEFQLLWPSACEALKRNIDNAPFAPNPA